MDYKEKVIALLKSQELSKEQKEKLENIFPELKESEDERIRKELMEQVVYIVPDKNETDSEGNVLPSYQKRIDKYIAWLEKQGEPMEINPTEFDTRLQTLIGKFDNLPKEELIGSLSFWMNVVQNDGTYKTDKKQSEQKPAEFDDTNAKRMFIKALERVEEQNNKGYKLTDCDKNSWWEDFKAYTSCIVEQKPTWSEEDEAHIHSLLDRLNGMCKKGSTFITTRFAVNQDMDWLKHLKQRIGG